MTGKTKTRISVDLPEKHGPTCAPAKLRATNITKPHKEPPMAFTTTASGLQFEDTVVGTGTSKVVTITRPPSRSLR